MRRVLASVLVGAALLALAAGPCAAPAALAAGEPPADAAANGDPLAGGAVAPDGAPGSRGPMLVVLRIAELLHLSDEQTIKVASEFRRVAQRRRELVAQKASLVTKLEGLLAQKPLDDAALTSATEQLIAVEHELGLLPEGLWKSIQPVLTPEQSARLILLRGKMRQQIEGERQRRRANGRDAAPATR